MTKEGARHPSVFTVDGYGTGPPPLPPRPRPGRRLGLTQVLLFLLVALALCGTLVEAWLIYRLYHPLSLTETADTMPSAAKMVGDAQTVGPTRWDGLVEAPPRPVAHLTDGQDVLHQRYVMSWSELGRPLLYNVGYRRGGLVFRENGYYYVYSKVTFRAEHSFDHSVELKNNYLLLNQAITLLKSRHVGSSARGNSFLAGVFYFRKDDSIFVRVSDTGHVARADPQENVFGVYMM